MSEQGTGGARENRAVIFGEGRIPGAKTFVLMEFEGREACVFVDRRVNRRWRESLLAFVSPYISSLPPLNRDRSRLNDNYRTLLQLSLVVFQKVYSV